MSLKRFEERHVEVDIDGEDLDVERAPERLKAGGGLLAEVAADAGVEGDGDGHSSERTTGMRPEI